MMSVDYFIRCALLCESYPCSCRCTVACCCFCSSLGANAEVHLIQLCICMQLKHKLTSKHSCNPSAIRCLSGSIGQLVNGGATDLFGRYAHLAGFRGSSSTSCLSFGWWAIIICLKNDRLAYGMLRRGLTSLTMHICIWLAAAAAAAKKSQLKLK